MKKVFTLIGLFYGTILLACTACNGGYNYQPSSTDQADSYSSGASDFQPIEYRSERLSGRGPWGNERYYYTTPWSGPINAPYQSWSDSASSNPYGSSNPPYTNQSWSDSASSNTYGPSNPPNTNQSWSYSASSNPSNPPYTNQSCDGQGQSCGYAPNNQSNQNYQSWDQANSRDTYQSMSSQNGQNSPSDDNQPNNYQSWGTLDDQTATPTYQNNYQSWGNQNRGNNGQPRPIPPPNPNAYRPTTGR